MAEHQFLEVLIPKQHHCENLKSHGDKLFSDIFV